MSEHNFRVVLFVDADATYFRTSQEAQVHVMYHGGRIECYVYGQGWVRWCPAMRERALV